MLGNAFSVTAFVKQSHLFLFRHRMTALCLFCFAWLVALCGALQSRTDMSTLSFFPDADTELVRMAEALHMAPFTRLLLVDFSFHEPIKNTDGQDTQAKEQLLSHAQDVLAALPKELVAHATAIPTLEPAKLLALVPALTDAKALAYLESQAQEDNIQKSLATAQGQLGQLWGGFSVPWLQHDPLAFRKIVFSHMPSAPHMGNIDTSTGLAVSNDGKHVLLMLRPQFSMHAVEEAAQLMHILERAVQQYVPESVRVTITGAHRHSAANASTIEADIQRILFWSLVGFAAVYVLFVRSWQGALWLLATPAVAGIFAWGAVSLVWPLIAGLALGFGASLLGIAEDYAMHMHFALRHARGRGESAASVVQNLYKPLLQAFIFNAAGFSVLLFSAIPALRQLAALALFTLTAGLICAVFFLPLWGSFASPPIACKQAKPAPSAYAAQVRVLPALACVCVLLVLCAVLWKVTPVDVSPQSMGADVAQIRQDMQEMRAIWGQNEGGEQDFWVVQGTSAEEALQYTQKLVHHLRQGGYKVESLSGLWPSTAQMHANIQRWKDFIQRHPHLEKTVQEYGLALGFTAETFTPFGAWLEQEPQAITAESLRHAGLGALVASFVEQGKNSRGETTYFSLVFVQGQDVSMPTPPQSLQPHAVRISAQEMEKKLLFFLEQERYLFPITGMVCLGLLLLLSPRKKEILLAALSPLVAINGILLSMLWQETPLTLASMAALPLVLGLAIDHGVIMVHELGQGREYGVRRAIVTSSCTAIMGMGLLTLADHPALQSMGHVIVVGLVVEMPVALWLVPLFYKKS